ncbi:hypothetical protein [Phyllobacterium endophyticum]
MRVGALNPRQRLVSSGLRPMRRASLPAGLSHVIQLPFEISGESPVKGKTPVFMEPLVAEVTFGAWTHGGKLRHTSFKGLREVADHAEVFDLTAKEQGDG